MLQSIGGRCDVHQNTRWALPYLQLLDRPWLMAMLLTFVFHTVYFVLYCVFWEQHAWCSEWLVGWVVAWLIDWMIDCLPDWWMSDCLIDCLIDWLVVDVLVDWLMDRLIDRQAYLQPIGLPDNKRRVLYVCVHCVEKPLDSCLRHNKKPKHQFPHPSNNPRHRAVSNNFITFALLIINSIEKQPRNKKGGKAGRDTKRAKLMHTKQIVG